MSRLFFQFCQFTNSDIFAPSPQVLQAYEKEGFPMLLQAFNDIKYLETLTGLDKLFEEGESAINDIDWHEEEDEF